MPSTFRVKGSISDGRALLRWHPIARAKVYEIDWLRKDRQWATLSSLEGEGITPNNDGVLQYIDECPRPMGPWGTYRVTAYFNSNFEGKSLQSAPVVLAPSKRQRAMLNDLSARLEGKKWSANVKSLIMRLKWTQHGWTMLLPKEAGQCLGKRIEVVIQLQTLSDKVLNLIAMIFKNLPKLARRSDKAFTDYGGFAALDEEDQNTRPRILLDTTPGKQAGNWTLIIEIKDSDFGWCIEFVGSQFKEIWSGG